MGVLAKIAAQHIKRIASHEDIIKSPEDKRHYRGLELNNGIKIILISDPETDKSAASMDVNIGYFMDPREIPGLAHFCEHMLFLGTEKYKEENEYSKFLSEHGGNGNAFTEGEYTNYYFDVSPVHLSDALDRFSQFFICPLFTASATEREVNAVNSENSKNLQDDCYRLFQLDASLADPSHDYSKFGTGNKDTLETIPKSKGTDIRDELLKFHSKYYSSNIMSLSVLGKETIEELTEMVVPLFASVVNKHIEVPEWKQHPFGPNQLKKICYAVPVKDNRGLSIYWPIPDLQSHYASKPGQFLGHLIGHESQGSLLYELKKRGWVNFLSSGDSAGAKGYMFFMLNVDLTEDGLEHVDDIVTLAYQYINMLKKEGAQHWIFKECQDLQAMEFRFKDKENPIHYVSTLARQSNLYPLSEILSGPYLISEYRPDLVKMVLDNLTPDKMRINVISQKFKEKVDSKEKWYGTEYKLEDIPAEKLQVWCNSGLHDNLKLPEKNIFIPTDLDLCPRETNASILPEIIKDSPMTRLWFKQDNTFLLPKACISIAFTSPVAYLDPEHCNMTRLFVDLFEDALNEYSYFACLSGLYYELLGTSEGMELSIEGYHEKQPLLLKKIMEKLTSFVVDAKRFEIFKEMRSRTLKNFLAEQPHRHSTYFTSVLISEPIWTREEKLQTLDALPISALDHHISPRAYGPLADMEERDQRNQQDIPEIYLEKNAIDVINMVEDILQTQNKTQALLPSQIKGMREIQLPDDSYYLYERVNTIHKSCSVELYYQCGMQGTHTNMLLELLVQILAEPCFDILRTKEQLGYLVSCDIRASDAVLGLSVTVQSEQDSLYVESRIEAFINGMEDHITQMSEETYYKHVQSLVTQRSEKPKTIFEVQANYWGEIDTKHYNFDRDNIEVAFLQTITKEDVLKFFKSNIAVGAPKRHKLSVHIVPSENCKTMNKSTEADGKNICNTLVTPCIQKVIEPGNKEHWSVFPEDSTNQIKFRITSGLCYLHFISKQ